MHEQRARPDDRPAGAPDWPTGYGFLTQIVDGRAIKPSGGNEPTPELNDPEINEPARQGDPDDRRPRHATRRWSQIDQKVMDAGARPAVRLRQDLLYRPTRLTNVFVTQAYRHVRLRCSIGVDQVTLQRSTDSKGR